MSAQAGPQPKASPRRGAPKPAGNQQQGQGAQARQVPDRFWENLYIDDCAWAAMFVMLLVWIGFFCLIGIWGIVNPRDLCIREPGEAKYYNILLIASLMGPTTLILSLSAAFKGAGNLKFLRAYFDLTHERLLWFTLTIFVLGVYQTYCCCKISEYAGWFIDCARYGGVLVHTLMYLNSADRLA